MLLESSSSRSLLSFLFKVSWFRLSLESSGLSLLSKLTFVGNLNIVSGLYLPSKLTFLVGNLNIVSGLYLPSKLKLTFVFILSIFSGLSLPSKLTFVGSLNILVLFLLCAYTVGFANLAIFCYKVSYFTLRLLTLGLVLYALALSLSYWTTNLLIRGSLCKMNYMI